MIVQSFEILITEASKSIIGVTNEFLLNDLFPSFRPYKNLVVEKAACRGEYKAFSFLFFLQIVSNTGIHLFTACI